MTRTVLNVVRLRVERGSTVILGGISWRVRQGEHWAVLGANGSGKTTLLSALTAYLSPTSGVIEVLGNRYGETDWRELRKRIGLVSSSIRQWMADDEPALETVISGKYAVIDYAGPVKPADRRRAIGILRKIECGHLLKRPWRVLSQGERQRLLIGRALMAGPPLLVLDEPCAGLDPVARERFLQFLQRLGRRRHAPTLVLVTHHIEEIIPAISHVLLLKAGKVMDQGAKETVLTSARLSRAFDAKIKLQAIDGRYSLTVAPSASVAI